MLRSRKTAVASGNGDDDDDQYSHPPRNNAIMPQPHGYEVTTNDKKQTQQQPPPQQQQAVVDSLINDDDDDEGTQSESIMDFPKTITADAQEPPVSILDENDPVADAAATNKKANHEGALKQEQYGGGSSKGSFGVVTEKSMSFWIVVGAIVILACAITSVVTGMIVRHHYKKNPRATSSEPVDMGPLTSPEPTAAPVLEPTLYLTPEELFDFLRNATPGSDLRLSDDEEDGGTATAPPSSETKAPSPGTSPQTMAYRWMVQVNRSYTGTDQVLQRYALATWYYATNQQGWDSPFLSPQDECQWTALRSENADAVTTASTGENSNRQLRRNLGTLDQQEQSGVCDSLGRVTHLSSIDNDLSGTLPVELFLLTHLTELLLVDDLQGPISTYIGQLTLLQILRLGGGFVGKIPTEIALLAELEVLDLSSNSLDGEIPPELGQLVALQTLDLSSNFLEGPIPSDLGNLLNVDHFRFHDNLLNGSVPPEICNLRSPPYWNLFGSLGTDCPSTEEAAAGPAVVCCCCAACWDKGSSGGSTIRFPAVAVNPCSPEFLPEQWMSASCDVCL